MGDSRKKAEEVHLVPLTEFEETMRKVLSNSKKEIDSQVARIKASNKARRGRTKKRKV